MEYKRIRHIWLQKAAIIPILLGVFSAPVQAQLGPPPVIAVQPLGLSVSRGGTAVMTVVAVSLTSLSYKWYRNGVLIPGATGSIISLTNVSSSNAGNYHVEVRNASGTVTSATAALLILTDVVEDVLQILPIGNAQMTPSGFRIQLNGLTSSQCVIYASTNLADWTPIATNSPAGGIVDFTDPGAINRTFRYYKAMNR